MLINILSRVTTSSHKIGIELVPLLRATYGESNVFATDIHPTAVSSIILDITDVDTLRQLVKRNNVTVIIHLASLLSAVGEMNPQLALKVNDKFQ